MKEAVLSTNKWRELYVQCIRMMRTMYQQCRLVHGDLSEYNILYALPLCCGHPPHTLGTHCACRACRVVRLCACCACSPLQRYYKGELYFIDVSQSVEHDHPHALDFLRLVRPNYRISNRTTHATRHARNAHRLLNGTWRVGAHA